MLIDIYASLYKKVKNQKFTPHHVVEVGVHYPETSNILGFIEDGIRAELIEPDPLCIDRISHRFGTYTNVSIHPYAIFNTRRQLKLYRCSASTFVSELTHSPALLNDHYIPNEDDAFFAEAKLFSDIDDGTIDLLSIDTEGCEWCVLETMTSRPTIISIETHSAKKYKNPNLSKIKFWMKENGYKLWYKNISDSIFVKKDFKVSFLSRFF